MSIKKVLQYTYICDDCVKDGDNKMFQIPDEVFRSEGTQGCEEDNKHLCPDCLVSRLMISLKVKHLGCEGAQGTQGRGEEFVGTQG